MNLFLLRISLLISVFTIFAKISRADELIDKTNRTNYPVLSCKIESKVISVVSCNNVVCTREYSKKDFTCLKDSDSCTKLFTRLLIENNKFKVAKNSTEAIELKSSDIPKKTVMIKDNKVSLYIESESKPRIIFSNDTSASSAIGAEQLKETQLSAGFSEDQIPGCP